MSTVEILVNASAVVGSGLLLFGFYRVNSGKWTNKSFWYEVDNFVGALLIVAYQLYYHAFVTVFVNIIWATVAMVGLSVFIRRAYTHRKKRRTA